MIRVTLHSHSEQGFTLLEILLVTGIILVLIAITIPRAMRINTSAKYALVEQAAAEIGKWGMEWGTRNLESQSAADTCVLNDYISTLGNRYTGDGTSNWTNSGMLTSPVSGCRSGTPLQYAVADLIDAGKQPRNPFNGVSYFAGANGGGTFTTGLLYLARYDNNATTPPTHEYYFVYTGTDSQNIRDWHAGMGTGTPPPYKNMRNGIYMSRLVQ